MLLYNNNPRKQNNLSKTWRQLWTQHVMWTRSFIISTADNLGDLELVTQRLLRNPSDMANVLRPFYGDKIADEFQKLFTEHLAIAANLVNAAKAGDTQKVATLNMQWYENADDIAAFLASINKNWSEHTWQELLYDHLAMTLDEATYRLNGRYADDIEIYDSIENKALKMADYMTMGLTQQFRLQKN